MIRKIISMSVLGSLLTASLLAISSGDEQHGIDITDLTGAMAALGDFGDLDDLDGFGAFGGLDDFDPFGGFNESYVEPITEEGTHQGHPWGDQQPEFMNFFAMQGALQQARILNLYEAGVNDLIARLEATVETLNGEAYVRMHVVNAWVAEAPAWRGPLMCVLRSRWKVNAEYPWAALTLEWEPAKAVIEALVREWHRLNQ